ncbi:MAG: hypothetical protein K1Y36_12735 [Blastocatellia bacterium]|nr:hypothetical protein [Blastocatellia bacterium]
MGVFHFKGVFKEKTEDGRFLYFFYPDYIEAGEVGGVFAIKPNDWQPVIVVEANAEQKGLVSTDHRCVSGLAAKIKKHFEAEGQMPTEVFRIS